MKIQSLILALVSTALIFGGCAKSLPTAVTVQSDINDTQQIKSSVQKNDIKSSHDFSVKWSWYSDHAWMPVQFQSQFDTGANTNNWCCGLAAVNMGTAYLHGASPQSSYLQRMYEYLGMNAACNGKGTNPTQQVEVAKAVGNAQNSFESYLSWDQLKEHLRMGRPIVVGIDYSQISNKCSYFTGYHAVLLIGYNGYEGYWVVNDPLCRTADGGMNKRIYSDEFRRAAQGYSQSEGAYGVVLVK